MKKRSIAFLQNDWAFLLAFFVPFLTMFVIHAVKGVYPFGNSSLLTIDLGQQYVDFFSYYRHTLLEDPSSFFYSFSKSIGGDMVGLWAYYLTSPLNLLFLLLPQTQISLGVTIVTLLKYGLSGLSMAYFLHKAFDGKGFILVGFASSYALMGYTVVNQFNIMWLDGIILLPLVALGVEYLIHSNKGTYYTLMLALALFTNYYIGYMVCLFIVFYFIYRLTGIHFSKDLSNLKKIAHLAKLLVQFAWHSLLAGGITAFLLLPTLSALIESKVSYMKSTLDWSFDYPVPELVSKFMIGAFNFDQMPSGYPNVFVGSLALLSFCLYFFNASFSKKERLAALLLTSLFTLSMNIKALNKIWHAMQFPNWYPYRFSFVVCFFMIVLGFRSFQRSKGLTPVSTFFAVVVSASISLYVYQQEFDFIEPIQIVLTLLFMMITILLMILKNNRFAWLPFIFFIFTASEMAVNASVTLSRLSYVKQSSFSTYQISMQDISNQLQTVDPSFYRTEKTFLRSKNDSLQNNFKSITHFSSTFESAIPELFGHMGLPGGSGFLTYSNGTIFTDALFGVKYYLSEQNNIYQKPNEMLKERMNHQQVPLKTDSFTREVLTPALRFPLYDTDNEEPAFSLTLFQTKPDLRQYQKLSVSDRVILYQNPYALPLAFGSSSDILSVALIEHDPLQMQENILNALLGNRQKSALFLKEPFSSTLYKNIHMLDSTVIPKVERQDSSKEASVKYQFIPQSSEAYYLTMGSSVKDDDVSLFLNGVPFTQYDNYSDTLVLNMTNQNEGETTTFELRLKDESVSLDQIQLYRLDQSVFEHSIDELKQGGMIIKEYSNTAINGIVNIQPGQDLLMTTIPYSKGWSVKVDGVPVKTTKALDSLLAVPMKEGRHTLSFSYRTPYFAKGMIVSILSALLLLLTKYLKRNHPFDH